MMAFAILVASIIMFLVFFQNVQCGISVGNHKPIIFSFDECLFLFLIPNSVNSM